MKRYEEQKVVVGFREVVRVVECVNDGVDVERVWLVSTEVEAVQKVKRLIDIAIFGAKSVKIFGLV